MYRFIIINLTPKDAIAFGSRKKYSGLIALAYCADEAGGEVQPLTKRQRKRAKQLEEDRIRAAEQRQLQQPSPQSVLDYERLVWPMGDATVQLDMLACL